MAKEISVKHKFIVEYVLEHNCSRAEAYRQAFPTCGPQHAKHYAYKVFQRPEVQEYYQRRQKEVFDSMNINAERLALELASIALAEKDDEVYTASHKMKAIELLQKQLGLQTQKVEANIRNYVIDIEDDADDDSTND